MPRAGRRVNSATLADVAARAGVSLATASRVLNKSSSVRDETRTRVLNAVDSLGYKVDLRGRSLATGRSQVVGVLSSDLGDPDDLALVRAMMDEAVRADLRIHVAEGRGDATRRREAVVRWLDDGVDAIILLPERCPSDHDEQLATLLAEFTGLGGQVVHVGTREREIPGSVLLLEEHDAAADLGQSLARRGHHRFVVVASQPHELSGSRAKGFEAGVRRIHGDGASFALEVHAAAAESTGARVWRPHEHQLVDCVFAVTATSARIVTAQLSALGVAVPDEVSVATFGYTGQDVAASTVAAMMPTSVAAIRALQLAGQEGDDAMRVVGSYVVC